MATCQAVEQIINLHYTLCMLGVPLDGPSWLFGDNKSIVTSSTIPHSSLNKCWNALSYHKVHEAIASGFIHFKHIPQATILLTSLPSLYLGIKLKFMWNHYYFGKVKPPLILVWSHQRGVTNWSDVG